MPPESRGLKADVTGPPAPGKKAKFGSIAGVYIPVLLNILSILLFLRFGSVIGRVGLVGIIGLLLVAYFVCFITILSLSAIASNGEVRGGGAYYMISRSLGPEFGGSIGVLFYLSLVFNTSLNVVGLIDSLRLNLPSAIPHGYWLGYAMETGALVLVSLVSLAGSAVFSRASTGFLVVLIISILSIPVSVLARSPFDDNVTGVHFTGPTFDTFRSNLLPHNGPPYYKGIETLRDLFGVLFPATAGIFAGASMSGDLRNPSKAIPKGTLWATLSTAVLYLIVILSIGSSVSHDSLIHHTNVVWETSIWKPLILAGECALTLFSALMGIISAAKLLQALARDRILLGLSLFGKGTRRGDDPVFAVLLTYVIAQLALFADLNQIATLISMGYQMTFFVMNLACFLLKIGSAPNFRPGFKFFTWQTAFAGSILSAAAMFLIDETYAASAICVLIFLFLLIHYMSPPKHWGDVSQNLIYHQVRKYLLRLKPEHIKFWRPQIILIINDPRHHTRLIQFCNSMKKGALYILGHVIVTSDFNSGVNEAKLQQAAWTKYITEYSRIKAFVQLTMSPSIEWGIRNLILSAGLGGMRPNIAVLGFYNMDDLRRSQPWARIPQIPSSSSATTTFPPKFEGKPRTRRRGDTSARLLEGVLPTDSIRTEGMMSTTSYMNILEDLALRHRLNVAIGKGFQGLQSTRYDGENKKKYVDLWPIQMSAEIMAGDKSVLTTNFDTYTLILQLGFILLSVPDWKKSYKLRVLVFVEYENEVADEEMRVKALLEKLRIDARVLVFCLASGQLKTYESIVNGASSGSDTEQIVHDLLKDDQWWCELQRFRTEAFELSRSQEIASLGEILNPLRRRGSSPHIQDHEPGLHKRVSINDFLDLPKKPTISTVSKLGANLGIRTHQLDTAAFGNPADGPSDYSSSDDDSASSSSSNVDFNDLDPTFDHSTGAGEPTPSPSRRRLFGFPIGQTVERPLPTNRSSLLHSTGAGYGTVSATSTQPSSSQPRVVREESPPNTGNTTPLRPTTAGDSGQASSTATPKPPTRPTLSRLSSASRFTSKPRPETTISAETGSEPTITFSQPNPSAPARPERPPMSRNSSMGRFSSRPTPMTTVDTGDESGPRIMFAESEPPQTTKTPLRTPARSRRNSGSRPETESDAHLSIPDLLSSYNFGTLHQEEDHGSAYSTQSMPLSFNDLPSRAQHLIINELMRKSSGDTAVLLTTLPIPEEGTYKDEEASVRYLSDIELLCHDLPPVLLVLSNNMTVTVSL